MKKPTFILIAFSIALFSNMGFGAQPTKNEKALSRGPNEIKSFVYNWFSLFDRNAPVEEFLPFIAESNLEMKFPEVTLRSKEDFKLWYAGILKTVRKASHDIQSLNVQSGEGLITKVELVVKWSAVTMEGKKIEFLAHQNWRLNTQNQHPLIISYNVSAEPESIDSDGLTELHKAAGSGNIKNLKIALQHKSDLFVVDSRMGVSVLHKAVYSGNAEVVTYLLQKGALVDLQSPSNGNTPLHDALYFKPGSDTKVIKAILKFKPSLSIRNRAGFTPKESAKVLNDEDSLRLIEEYEKSLFTDKGMQLMTATKANDVEKVKDLLSIRGQPVEEADDQGFTPLIWAAREGFTEIVSLLLQKSANPNRLDKWMQANAGHKAAFWGRTEAMKLLVKSSLDINARGGYNGYTALHDATARGHVETAKVLLEAGAKIDIPGHDGKTAWDLAKSSGNPKIMALFK